MYNLNVLKEFYLEMQVMMTQDYQLYDGSCTTRDEECLSLANV